MPFSHFFACGPIAARIVRNDFSIDIQRSGRFNSASCPVGFPSNYPFFLPFFLLRQKVRISTSSEGGSCGEQGSARSVRVRMCDLRTGRTSWSTPFSPFFACDTIAARIVTRGFWVDIRLTRASKLKPRMILRIIVSARSHRCFHDPSGAPEYPWCELLNWLNGSFDR